MVSSHSIPSRPVHKERKTALHSNINTLNQFLGIGHFEVARQIRLLVCRVHFDPFWDAMTSFIGCDEVAQETGSKFLSQNSPIVQFDAAPTQSQVHPQTGRLQEWHFTYIYMKSNGSHEKNGSLLNQSPFLKKVPTCPPLTHVSFPKSPVREKQELAWVGWDPETVNNSTRSRFCLFVSRLSHYSDPFIVWWNYSSVVCVGDGHG